MHELLREERFYIREALDQFGPFLILTYGGNQTLEDFMQTTRSYTQLPQTLQRVAYEIFSCVHACHKHGVVHRVRSSMLTWTCACTCI